MLQSQVENFGRICLVNSVPQILFFLEMRKISLHQPAKAGQNFADSDMRETTAIKPTIPRFRKEIGLGYSACGYSFVAQMQTMALLGGLQIRQAMGMAIRYNILYTIIYYNENRIDQHHGPLRISSCRRGSPFPLPSIEIPEAATSFVFLLNWLLIVRLIYNL